MPTDPTTPLPGASAGPVPLPPPSSAARPPLLGAPPFLMASAPPPAAPAPPRPGTSLRYLLAFVLSVTLGFFLLDAVLSLIGNTLGLFFHRESLVGLRWITAFLVVQMACLIYGLMILTPMVPKRLFLPLTLFIPVALLALVPAFILGPHPVQQVAWAISLGQLLLGLGLLFGAQGGFFFRWPLVPEAWIGHRGFSWRNLLGFTLLNLLVFAPAILLYLAWCGALAVGHLSDGFVALRPGGFSVQARTYARGDGKTVQLIPMVHVGDAAFYRRLNAAFPTNTTILMEGVSDNRKLLTNHLSYQRMATSLGLSEQAEQFKPAQGQCIRADVDIEEFTPSTIGFLNLVMLIHAKGLNFQNLLLLMQNAPPPEAEAQLMDDLLEKRNRHLLKELDKQLPLAEHLIIPWGAAHIPGLAKEIQKAGFQLRETQEYTVVRFLGRERPVKSAQPAGIAPPPK